MLIKKYVPVLAAALIGTLSTAACASNHENTTPKASVSVSKQGELSALLPASLRQKGLLSVGISPGSAPDEYLDSKSQVAGFDVDLMTAVARSLGLKAKFVQSNFDNIIPSVTLGKYDIGVSSFTDTRKREKTVDFVDYFNAGTQWAAPTGHQINASQPCRLSVAVLKGTFQDTDTLPALNKACVAAGKGRIKVQEYQRQDGVTTAVTLGKADAFLADSTATAYAVKKSGGKLQLASGLSEAAPFGWVFTKTSPLVPIFVKAFKKLIDDGTYDQILKNYGIQGGAVKTPTVNHAKY